MMIVENLNFKRSVVSVIKANNYDFTELIPAVKKSLDLIGGLNAIYPYRPLWGNITYGMIRAVRTIIRM
jgi:hypothetical protein